MTEPTQPHGDEPKKKSLKLLLRSEPVAEVETSIGRIYLYPLRVRDMTDFGNLEPAEANSQVRNFLPSIGSLTVESDEAPERIPLDPKVAQTLSHAEVEQIAEAYVNSSEWQTSREGSQESMPAKRETGETASAYLIRLLKAEVEDYLQSTKRMHDKTFGSARSLFDQVRKSTSALGSTLNAYDELTKFAKLTPLEPLPVRTNPLDDLNRQMVQQARERAEERAEEMELTRLTGQMTAESAKTLKDLAEAATILMEQMDERDRRADQTTRTQIKIALMSVVFSAILALVAATFSGLSYFQDRNNLTSSNEWQANLLTAMERMDQRYFDLAKENQALRKEVSSLKDSIESPQVTQHAANEANKKEDFSRKRLAATP